MCSPVRTFLELGGFQMSLAVRQGALRAAVAVQNWHHHRHRTRRSTVQTCAAASDVHTLLLSPQRRPSAAPRHA